MSVTTLNTSCHLEIAYIHHYSVADGQIGARVGYLMQNSTQIYCDPVKIAKRRIAIWQTFIFPNHK